MQDFTTEAYKLYVEALRNNYDNIYKFSDFFLLKKRPSNFVLLRHDVDRLPKHALRLARLEAEMGVHSTYYFRAKPHTFIPTIMQSIEGLGHEIGYHYENLSDCNGNREKALMDFRKNLDNFRNYVNVRTISMHGRPLSKYDNRDIWLLASDRHAIFYETGVLGEIYLDIDYLEVAYITDTGRNWLKNKSNIRDIVKTNIPAEFNNGIELLNAFNTKVFPKICFLTHPERWSHNLLDYYKHLLRDRIVNIGKNIWKKI